MEEMASFSKSIKRTVSGDYIRISRDVEGNWIFFFEALFEALFLRPVVKKSIDNIKKETDLLKRILKKFSNHPSKFNPIHTPSNPTFRKMQILPDAMRSEWKQIEAIQGWNNSRI